MNWNTSDRRSRLPSNWSIIRARIWRRDSGLCQHIRYDTGMPCFLDGAAVDHVINNDDHSDSNLQVLCAWHHAQKTGKEGAAGRAKARSSRSLRTNEPRIPGRLD
ncbi:HNH endonuclease [Streptomyces sp. NPDC059002]|uniref:HNH endonuclease n=1 Tax=Streptomyces sp. NPDC059002 TaxID=3346690 RepID=UPI0036CD19B0